MEEIDGEEDDEEEKYNLQYIKNSNVFKGVGSDAGNKLKTFSEIPINRWINLLNIEIIQDKNKASKEQEIEIPFFLDFENPLNKVQQETEGELLEKNTIKITSKVIRKHETKKYLEELGTPLEKNLGEISLEDKMNKSNRKVLKTAFNELKTSGASYIDYQIKRACFNSIENVVKLLMMFSVIMKSVHEFDIKNAIFKSFLDVRLLMISF